MTGPLLLLLGALGLAGCFALARHPLVAVGLVPAGAGIALVPIPGLPVELLVAHGLAALSIAAVISHLILHTDRRTVHLPTGRGLVACGWFVLFGVVVLASALVGIDSVRYASITISTMLGIGYALCVVAVVTETRQLVLLLGAFAFGAVTATAPALTQSGNVQSQLGGAVVSGRATGAFTDPNELGVYSALAIILCLTLALTARSRPAQALGVAAAVLAFGALLVSYSRLSWLAAPVGLLVLVLHAPARRFVLRVAPPVSALGLFSLLMIGVDFPLQAFLDRLASLGGSTNPDDVRVQAWREAFRLMWERPLIGSGPGSFLTLAETPPSVIWAAPVNHPHNAVLTVLVEQGIIGAVVLGAVAVTLVGGLLGVILRHLHPEPAHRTIAFGALAALVLLAVNLVADYQLRNPYVMVTVWFLAGIAAATVNLAGPTVPQPPSPSAEEPEHPMSETFVAAGGGARD